MPSGKKSKQARRTAALKPPPVQSKGGPRRRQANPRVLAIGAAVVVLAAVGIGLAIALSGGGSGVPSDVPTYGSLATGGSLFFSEVAHFFPCELCWYQRICMYPLSITTLLVALAGDHRAARYLLPLPVVGAGVSVYHLLIENKVIAEPRQCLASAAGGCATKWINEFGYITIPTLALTEFVLLIGFLALAAAGGDDDAATLPHDA